MKPFFAVFVNYCLEGFLELGILQLNKFTRLLKAVLIELKGEGLNSYVYGDKTFKTEKCTLLLSILSASDSINQQYAQLSNNLVNLKKSHSCPAKYTDYIIIIFKAVLHMKFIICVLIVCALSSRKFTSI